MLKIKMTICRTVYFAFEKREKIISDERFYVKTVALKCSRKTAATVSTYQEILDEREKNNVNWSLIDAYYSAQSKSHSIRQ